MRLHQLRFVVFVAGALWLGLGAINCQKVDKPKTTLTQKQWKEVKSHILDEEPDVDFPVGANYDDKIELVGFDVSTPLKAGESATFTWYWKALEDIDDNWKIFVHFDSSEKSYRQNLDHHPMEGLYRTGRWKEGQIIEDIQKVDINSDFPEGQAVPYVGFFRGNKRMPIKNDVKKTDDRRVIGPTLDIESGKKSADKPDRDEPPSLTATELDSDDDVEVEVDGKLDEEIWDEATAVDLEPLSSAKPRDTRVQLAYDDQKLYVGARLEDEHIWSEHKDRDSRTWEEEVFEVFIDPEGRDGDDYVELQINPLGTIFDANFEEQLGSGEGSRDEQIKEASSWDLEGLESSVHVEGTVNDDSDTDDYWSVELAIPFEELPATDGAPDEEWAVNFYRYDRPDDDTTHAYAWSAPTSGSFHQVERFGTVAFGDSEADDESSKIEAKQRNEAAQKLQKRLKERKIKAPKGVIDRNRAASESKE
ncbi:MAG: carbohydrate-binding family 9-like protein [Persicimonas sp.]